MKGINHSDYNQKYNQSINQSINETYENKVKTNK